MGPVSGCRGCGVTTTEVLDLGDQYLSDFNEGEKPPRFPLRLRWCPECFLAQLDTTVPRGLMYHERYGFRSGVNDTIRADLKDIVEQARLRRPHASRWLDIASNDGTLLSYIPDGVYRVGVDPVAKYCALAEQHASRVVNDFFSSSFFKQGEFEIVTSISMFYDLDDPDRFVREVKDVLAQDGLWVIQQNHLLPMIQLGAVDNICHEHVTYYSLLSLERLLRRHGLEVWDVETSMVNGGVFRAYVSRKGWYPRTRAVRDLLEAEVSAGLNTEWALLRFAHKARVAILGVGGLVRERVRRGDEVFIYGASTRGATLIQAAGLTDRELPFAVDRNPEKVGKVMAAVGSRIISEETFRGDPSDYLLVSPWFFRDEFIQREHEYLERGGRMIFPLPTLEVL